MPFRKMKISIELVETEIIVPPNQRSGREVGAIVDFVGAVREGENDQTISALRYEAYETMAISEIKRLLLELAETFPCQYVHVIHRHGWIHVGETAIFIRVESKHRQQAFGMVTAFMDRLKLDVPIWKVESRSE